MTQSEFTELQTLLTKHTFDARPKALDWLSRQTIDIAPTSQELPQEPPKGTWTDDQREAFHVGCQELADYFTAHGLDMKAVLKHDVDIPWTKDTVKEFIFRPIMLAMFGYKSHTQLKKGEVSKLWDVAMKHLGERCYQNRQGEEVVIAHMDFPHDPTKGNDKIKGITLAKKLDYPVDPYEGKETGTFG